jgi:hypothetical protein
MFGSVMMRKFVGRPEVGAYAENVIVACVPPVATLKATAESVENANNAIRAMSAALNRRLLKRALIIRNDAAM